MSVKLPLIFLFTATLFLSLPTNPRLAISCMNSFPAEVISKRIVKARLVSVIWWSSLLQSSLFTIFSFLLIYVLWRGLESKGWMFHSPVILVVKDCNGCALQHSPSYFISEHPGYYCSWARQAMRKGSSGSCIPITCMDCTLPPKLSSAYRLGLLKRQWKLTSPAFSSAIRIVFTVVCTIVFSSAITQNTVTCLSLSEVSIISFKDKGIHI